MAGLGVQVLRIVNKPDLVPISSSALLQHMYDSAAAETQINADPLPPMCIALLALVHYAFHFAQLAFVVRSISR